MNVETQDMGYSFRGAKLEFDGGVKEYPSISIAKGESLWIIDDGNSLMDEFMYVLGAQRIAILENLPSNRSGLIPIDPDNIPDNYKNLVTFEGECLLTQDVSTISKKVGFVFRDASTSFVCRTTEEEFYFQNFAQGQNKIREYRLKNYGLYHQRDTRPEHLSGGEQQRLNCTSFMEGGQTLIVVDFFGTNLDKEFEKYFNDWHKVFSSQGGVAIIRVNDPNRIPQGANFLLCKEGEFTFSKDRRKLPKRTKLSARKPMTDAKEILAARDATNQHCNSPISLTMKTGEIIILCGPNGSGKSSFLNAVLGDLPTNGELIMDIEDVAPVCSYQHSNAYLQTLKLSELGLSETLKEICGIEGFPDETVVGELNSTMRKKIDIATSTTIAKSLVLLDEPTSGLSWDGPSFIQEILNTFPEKAFLIATHDDAIASCGNVINLQEL